MVLNLNPIDATIGALAHLILISTSLTLNTPDNYMPLNGIPIDLSGQNKLKVLNLFVMVLSILQIGGSAWFIEPIYDQIESSAKFYIMATFWTLMLLVSTRLNKPQNAYAGGHFAIFFALLLIGSVHFYTFAHLFESLPIEWTMAQIITASQAGIIFVLLLTVGFWTNRNEADDEEMISLEKGSSIFSKLMFSWVTPMVSKGAIKPIEEADMWSLLDEDVAEHILTYYHTFRNETEYLGKRILKLSIPFMLWQYAAGLIGVILSFSSPYYLFQIVRKVSDPSADRLSVIPLILGLFACNCGKTICDGQMYFIGRRIGTRARVIIIDELYKKSLHRVQGASADDEKASLGKIVTLMSVDAEAIREFLSYSSEFLFNLPLSIVISISSLYFVMGWSAFVGVALVGLIGPISSKLAGWMVKYQKILLENTDNRVSLVNEMLQGIRIVKYFAWEHLWIKRVTEAREKELKSFMDLFKVYIAFGVLGSGSSIVITFATFAVYTLVAGNTLDAATAFTAVNLLTVVNNQLAYLPAQVAHVFKAKVSLDRIADYLKEQDIDKYTKKLENVTEPVGVIGFKNAELKYHGGDEADANSGNFTLRDLEVEFQIGKLSVVAGSTGSGKSSLILGLLGGINRINLEMKLESGEIMFPSGKNRKVDPFTGLSQTVAYCAQNAWLLNATIRDNILFGEPYDEKRYNSVIRGCALAKDLENLDGGDLTEIGEKGINVSGGQKQRISLARACYSKSSFVLLDDPLSAVDAPTARFLLHKCILGLLKGRTVILVSHATNLVVPFADRVVVMKNGEICAQGTPYEITNHATDETVKGLSLELDIFDNEKEGYSEDDGQIAATIAGGGTGLVQKEEKATGSVKLSLYKYYLVSAGGFVFAFFFVSSFGLTQGSQFIMDFWLKIWTDSTKVNHFSINTMSFNPEYSSDTTTYSNLWMQPHSKTIFSSLNAPEHPPLYYIGVYAILGVFVVIANQLQTLVYLLGSLWASKKIHAELLTAILYSPLRFFEITPIGRVLNRFSKDIGQIDNDVLGAIDFFIMKVVQGVTIIVIIATIEPLFLVIMPFIAYVYIQVAQLYLLTSRELKRIEANSRSPIYAQFSETLAGVSTLRAYGAEKRFEKLNEQKMNENHQPFFFIWGANRWLSVRTDIISAYVVLCAGFVIVFADVNAGWAAILLSYSMQFTNALLWGVRMHAEMEMNMNSVERIEEYCTLEQEPPAIIESHRPSPEWPQHGAIEVQDLSIRYAPDLPDVLQNVSFNVLPSEKVAVVGRTGAGKSTLSLAFFRIISLSGGSITIDGENISEIGLYDLRSKLTIIPQDPVLFTGDLRSNLDPFNQHDDEKIWESLKRVHFMESLQQAKVDKPEDAQSPNEDDAKSTLDPNAITLDFKVQENGGNFSQGQRQLLCLARSLLQGNKIILLDEATASVDNDTDAKIQTTIRTEFADRTILCIAHRLRTVIDYDKILVLDKGKVLEFGTPLELINLNGTFRSMCEDTGEFDDLVELAKNASFKA